MYGSLFGTVIGYLGDFMYGHLNFLGSVFIKLQSIRYY